MNAHGTRSVTQAVALKSNKSKIYENEGMTKINRL